MLSSNTSSRVRGFHGSSGGSKVPHVLHDVRLRRVRVGLRLHGLPGQAFPPQLDVTGDSLVGFDRDFVKQRAQPVGVPGREREKGPA